LGGGKIRKCKKTGNFNLDAARAERGGFTGEAEGGGNIQGKLGEKGESSTFLLRS